MTILGFQHVYRPWHKIVLISVTPTILPVKLQVPHAHTQWILSVLIYASFVWILTILTLLKPHLSRAHVWILLTSHRGLLEIITPFVEHFLDNTVSNLCPWMTYFLAPDVDLSVQVHICKSIFYWFWVNNFNSQLNGIPSKARDCLFILGLEFYRG